MFSGLSALRRQLHSEQKRLEDRMQQQDDWEELESPVSDRSDHQTPSGDPPAPSRDLPPPLETPPESRPLVVLDYRSNTC